MLKKGFTLFELLVTIVILGIISLIITPIVMNVINGVKKGSARDSAYAIIEAATLEAAMRKISPPIVFTENDRLNYKGIKPSKMNLIINRDGKTRIQAYIGGYCVIKNYDDMEIVIDNKRKSKDICVDELTD